ncbi:MAG: hypothetical protein GY913_06050 [Proteobacteria bacterium]|nr:hypothetical protein [Pseudomonadota bacterium]MCP4916468.1 hypothetical protein [Pseudomonadota bacterium]
MENEIVLLYLGVMGAMHLIPLWFGVRHHRRLEDRLRGFGEDAGLEPVGSMPVWHTHGKGVVWSGTENGRQVSAELRFDPKKRVYAKVRVEQKRRVTDGLFVTPETCSVLETIGWTELEVTHDKDDVWRLTFQGADGFGMLSDLSRWDPSRDKGPVPTDLGDYVQARLGPWLEIGYRDLDPGELRKAIQMQALLIEQLENEEDRDWKALVLRDGLARSRDVLSGRVRGHAIQVRYDHDSRTTRIEAAVTGPPLHIAHKDHIDATRPIANQVLGMLVGAWAPPDVDLAPLFEDEALCEALLAVVHAWPRSSVRDGRIELVAFERLRQDLPGAVVDLADRMEAVWRA